MDGCPQRSVGWDGLCLHNFEHNRYIFVIIRKKYVHFCQVLSPVQYLHSHAYYSHAITQMKRQVLMHPVIRRDSQNQLGCNLETNVFSLRDMEQVGFRGRV